MADHPVDRRIDAILAKYDLRDKTQYRNAIAELTSYLITLRRRDTVNSLYYQRMNDKIHLERCLKNSPDEPQPS
jgi:hypothetical protein